MRKLFYQISSEFKWAKIIKLTVFGHFVVDAKINNICDGVVLNSSLLAASKRFRKINPVVVDALLIFCIASKRLEIQCSASDVEHFLLLPTRLVNIPCSVLTGCPCLK